MDERGRLLRIGVKEVEGCRKWDTIRQTDPLIGYLVEVEEKPGQV